MEVMDPSGHITLTWSADDPESVENARAEFDRLQACGYAFFTTADEDAQPVKKLTKKLRTELRSLDVRPGEPVQTREFTPRARRTVAVPPMRGG